MQANGARQIGDTHLVNPGSGVLEGERWGRTDELHL